MIRLLTLTAVVVSLATFAAFMYGASVGYASNYKMVINHQNRSAIIVAYRGRITALHIQYDEDGQVKSKWRLSARQLIFGNQWIRIFEEREQLFGIMNDDKVTRENLLSQHLWFRFSRLDRVGDTIYIWDNHPVPTLYKGTVEGQLIHQ
ncbi:hypothetical protein AKJ18_06945 [Vibrio xuii]|nr:hypothetical protein AKJ18_06945 [Vibrio xuii]